MFDCVVKYNVYKSAHQSYCSLFRDSAQQGNLWVVPVHCSRGRLEPGGIYTTLRWIFHCVTFLCSSGVGCCVETAVLWWKYFHFVICLSLRWTQAVTQSAWSRTFIEGGVILSCWGGRQNRPLGFFSISAWCRWDRVPCGMEWCTRVPSPSYPCLPSPRYPGNPHLPTQEGHCTVGTDQDWSRGLVAQGGGRYKKWMNSMIAWWCGATVHTSRNTRLTCSNLPRNLYQLNTSEGGISQLPFPCSDTNGIRVSPNQNGPNMRLASVRPNSPPCQLYQL